MTTAVVGLHVCSGCGPTPGSAAHAAEVLAAFTEPGANQEALTRALRPKPDDYAAVFAGDAARKVQVWEDRLWDAGGGKVIIHPAPEQAEIRIDAVSQPALRRAEHEGDRQRCLGGHASIADKLQPGTVLHCARFMKPGEGPGVPVDVLVWVNGHWAFFPTPFPPLE